MKTPGRINILLVEDEPILAMDRAKRTYPAAYLHKPVQLSSLRTAIELAIHNAAERPALPAVVERDGAGREALLQRHRSA